MPHVLRVGGVQISMVSCAEVSSSLLSSYGMIKYSRGVWIACIR